MGRHSCDAADMDAQVALLQECRVDVLRSGSSLLGDLGAVRQAAFQVALRLLAHPIRLSGLRFMLRWGSGMIASAAQL